MITTKTTMKTNATISSSIIAVLMMMLFSHASHAATIIQQNGTVKQLTSVYYDEETPMEYYAEALADVETLVRFYIFSLSLFFSAFSKKWTTDRERCAKVRWQSSREARATRVGFVAFLNRLVIHVFGRRARLFLDSLWMMIDGCKKFEISRGKIKQRATRRDTMMMMIMIMMIMMLTIFIFFLFISLSRTLIHIQMHYTDDRTFIEY